jgi:hypothetical protein
MEQEFPTRHEYDAWWKLFLQGFLKEFLELVAPDLHAMIDWGRACGVCRQGVAADFGG